MTSAGQSTGERLRDAVKRILSEAREGIDVERRCETRVSLFQVALVGLGEGQTPCFSAFLLAFSLREIELIHLMPLSEGEVVVRVFSRSSDTIDFRVHIDWSYDCWEGWYISGGRLLDMIGAAGV